MDKKSSCSARGAEDASLTPGSGRSLGRGRGNPLQYSCLENSMDRGAWRATVHRVAKSWTRLKRLSTRGRPGLRIRFIQSLFSLDTADPATLRPKQQWTTLPDLLAMGKVKVKVAQTCPTLCDPMDCTAHGILQARILDWVAFPFSRGSSQPRD